MKVRCRPKKSKNELKSLFKGHKNSFDIVHFYVKGTFFALFWYDQQEREKFEYYIKLIEK